MEENVLEMLVELCDDEVVREDLDVELFETGLIDSLGFTELLVDIEDRFGVVISPSELEREEMNTPRKIIALIAQRSAQA
ncbi:D-alanine--poly(phosphoribitol) ligase subunit 2 [Bittarella massiliensis]|uniref:D-alanyl carrier protein n=1 Tax=Bittarella massiliensis (ex Durand et al. 2017) TaxID=1720313 RepID=A0AAP1PW62_9FIRM|nr:MULTISPECIES: D-alanine--poly(phosphoribitol) ligase subunit 2 [Eubacteriales]MCB5941966.1 D-alanine--poly(phosphoribitol) ligase subunit 2 [bacterium 210820-DFI.6.52]ERI99951.1 D-alanine--poly(phosphoribitol) ligase, subunit 2 [Clostridium sp. ATCC 29733]MBC2870129.1 D-alanine--poly(phosphoribitol) ligase subunit 2 [Bittarella massiliensis (ex Durand et al. 2017)]MZL68269.1 D-alanine--poly(phosphoribitol) ligase subunit 2 [Bittarella massiliensis (ex Durand et al. 2017)]MZL79676.1 D-alanin